jgi:hypothetical protein
MNEREERGPWYLFTGILIGILLGVGYTRYFQPVEYVDTAPASLQQVFKDQYRAMIAAAYLANGDLVRAKARLELLEDEDLIRALTEQAQRTLAEDGSSEEARALGLLAIALGQAPPGPGQAITPAPNLPTGTSVLSTPASLIEANPAPTGPSEPRPETAPVSPTDPGALPSPPEDDGSYVLLSQEKVCDQSLPAPLIQIQVSDEQGEPIPGVLIVISWVGGEERFYTGLKPEINPGYADFTLNPEFVYSVRVGEGSSPLGNLTAVSCSSDEGTYWGSILLKFGQP